MSSNSQQKTPYLEVMEATGFYRNGVPTTGVIEARLLRNNELQLDKRIKYSAVINQEQINATAVFELSGSPCIYFTELEQPDPDPQELARLHKLSWNHGLAPMLWAITPSQVLLYNCYSKPKEEDRTNPKNHLIGHFENTDKGLNKLNQYASRLQIESGAFWQWNKAKKINRQNQRIDEVLVKDLTDTEQKLVKEKGLKRSVAQTLLIQSIFLAYLQDRGVLKPNFLRQNFGGDNLTALFENKLTTDRLFDWTKQTFNGDLFTLSSEDINLVKSEHLEVVKTFIGGLQEVETGQLRLWRAYDFKVIPVELISAIYEKFIYAEDSDSAKKSSTHYTPLNLVDLVLSEVFRFGQINSNAKILDLACGSGVFLVDALRRLVVKRLANGEQYSRKLIRDTLYQQIYGVDINSKAIQITAFSLYLTALELEYELEEYPSISENLKFQKIIGQNLFVGDAFDTDAEFNQTEPFSQKQFNAIIGNPPWTKSKDNKSASKFCERKRPAYPQGYPIARSDTPDQAFLWRVRDFANQNTLIGLLLHGKPFFRQTSQARKAKEALLMNFRPKVIINLSKLRNQNLFPKSKAPAMILIAHNIPAQPQDSLYFACPELTLDYKRHGIIEIGSEQIKQLPVFCIASDPDVLKIASWGTARDLNLIQFLRQSFAPLKQLLNQKGWNFGRGFFAGSGDNEIPDDLYGKKWLPSGIMKKYQVNTDILQPLEKKNLERPRDSMIYKSPLVIVTRGIQASGFFSAFSQEDVIYVDSYIGISVPLAESNMAHYLNCVFNSSLATYFLFLTASSWGIERDKVEKKDLEDFPIALPNSSNKKTINQILEIEKHLRYSNLKTDRERLQKSLDQLIFDLYGLNREERILIDDTVNFTVDLFMKRGKSKGVKRSQGSELELYAKYLISILQPFLQTLNERTIIADVMDFDNAPLTIVKFSIVPVPRRDVIVKITSGQNLETVLKNIAKQLPQYADRIYSSRNLRVYVGEDIYIIKPAKRIYWTRSVGLNDADLILSESLNTNHAPI